MWIHNPTEGFSLSKATHLSCLDPWFNTSFWFSLLEYMAVTCDNLGSGSSPTFANPPTFESTLNLALTSTLPKPATMSRFAPHRSSNSNPQDSGPPEGLHILLQGRGQFVQAATYSD